MAVMDEMNTVATRSELNRRLREIVRRVEIMEAIFRRRAALRTTATCKRSAHRYMEEP